MSAPSPSATSPRTTTSRLELVRQLRAEAVAAHEQLSGLPGVVAGGILHLAGLCDKAADEIERQDRDLAYGQQQAALSETAATPIDPDSEAANPVWDLVIHACAQAWPAGKLAWNNSPTELIVDIINERDEALALLRQANNAALTGMAFSEDAPVDLYRDVPAKIKARVDGLYAAVEAAPSATVAPGQPCPTCKQKVRW